MPACLPRWPAQGQPTQPITTHNWAQVLQALNSEMDRLIVKHQWRGHD